MQVQIGTSSITTVVGDITQQPDADAIVNAANARLMGGSGVCGAIFRAAGAASLQESCNEWPPNPETGVRCPTGQARVTPAHGLPNKGIIHAVGPIYTDSPLYPDQMAQELASAYWQSLVQAERQGWSTVAFPAVSCGIYGYPTDEAATVAIQTVAAYLRTQFTKITEVRFVFIPFADGPRLQGYFEGALAALNGFESASLSEYEEEQAALEVDDFGVEYGDEEGADTSFFFIGADEG